jgi:hypothetical protein
LGSSEKNPIAPFLPLIPNLKPEMVQWDFSLSYKYIVLVIESENALHEPKMVKPGSLVCQGIYQQDTIISEYFTTGVIKLNINSEFLSRVR